jgi:hypothetical protein
MQKHRRFEQQNSLDTRLIREAQRLRKEAGETQPGLVQETLVRRARQAETAAQIHEWLTSPGLQAPV